MGISRRPQATPDGSYLAARRDGEGDWPDSFPPPGVEAAATTGRASEEASSLS